MGAARRLSPAAEAVALPSAVSSSSSDRTGAARTSKKVSVCQKCLFDALFRSLSAPDCRQLLQSLSRADPGSVRRDRELFAEIDRRRSEIEFIEKFLSFSWLFRQFFVSFCDFFVNISWVFCWRVCEKTVLRRTSTFLGKTEEFNRKQEKIVTKNTFLWRWCQSVNVPCPLMSSRD